MIRTYKEFLVYNNTDYPDPVRFHDYDEADKFWRGMPARSVDGRVEAAYEIAPGPDAGNKYSARFVGVCAKCGDHVRQDVEYDDSCSCDRRGE